MTPKPADPFFVGYFKKVPQEIKRFALAAGAAMVVLLALSALALPLATPDPGAGRYSDDLRGGALAGVVDLLPYPILRVPASDTGPARAVLLGGQAKNGAQGFLPRAGEAVELRGVFVRRGDSELLLIGQNGVAPAAPLQPAFRPAPAEDLGRWRLTGEICDGKCQAGAMKPGRGLAHKACANLCILEGLPPVLVMDLPVAGKTTVLLAAADGGPLPDALLRLTAVPLQIAGQLERRDDMLIFRVDSASVREL